MVDKNSILSAISETSDIELLNNYANKSYHYTKEYLELAYKELLNRGFSDEEIKKEVLLFSKISDDAIKYCKDLLQSSESKNTILNELHYRGLNVKDSLSIYQYCTLEIKRKKNYKKGIRGTIINIIAFIILIVFYEIFPTKWYGLLVTYAFIASVYNIVRVIKNRKPLNSPE